MSPRKRLSLLLQEMSFVLFLFRRCGVPVNAYELDVFIQLHYGRTQARLPDSHVDTARRWLLAQTKCD
uniref:Putative secreted protein synganglion overexpressed n=1 Tax=Rhipicephalus microplus TaxID=6941 RepID=A0A6M2DER6_RHIMP